MEYDIFRTKRIGWFGQRQSAGGQLREWLSDIEKRVSRIESDSADSIREPSKQRKLPGAK